MDFGQQSALRVESAAVFAQLPLVSDRNVRSAMQEDAKRIVDNLVSSYKESKENSSIEQVYEMMEVLVIENQHECLGVSPEALKDIFDLVRDKIILAKQDFDELE